MRGKFLLWVDFHPSEIRNMWRHPHNWMTVRWDTPPGPSERKRARKRRWESRGRNDVGWTGRRLPYINKFINTSYIRLASISGRSANPISPATRPISGTSSRRQSVPLKACGCWHLIPADTPMCLSCKRWAWIWPLFNPSSVMPTSIWPSIISTCRSRCAWLQFPSSRTPLPIQKTQWT